MAQRKPGAPSSFHFCIRNRSQDFCCAPRYTRVLSEVSRKKKLFLAVSPLSPNGKFPRSRPTGEEFEELRNYDNGVTDFRPHLNQGWRTSEHSKARCLANFLDELFLPNFLSPSENSNYVRNIESILFATILFYNLINDWYGGNYY